MINGAGGVTSGFGAFAAVPNRQTSSDVGGERNSTRTSQSATRLTLAV